MKKIIAVMILGLMIVGCSTAPEEEPAAEAPVVVETPAEEPDDASTESVDGNSEKEDVADYSYKTVVFENGENIVIEYPQIQGMKGELSQDYINQSLKKIVDIYSEGNYKSVDIGFETMYMDNEFYSVVYSGKVEIEGFKEFEVVKSMTLDMHSTNEINVDNFIVGDNKLQTLKNLFESEGIQDFEAESVFLYFMEDQVVFYYMPLDDDADFRFIPIKIEGNGDYFNWDFGPHPAS